MAEQAGGGAPEGKPLNILIVDDSTVMRLMIRRVTQLAGVPIAHIYEAGNGQEAMDILRAHEVDALFTDINMPVMSGTDLLRLIAADQRWARLLRVIVSTDGSDARRQEVQDLNVRLYIEKPFRPEVMRDVLSTITANPCAA